MNHRTQGRGPARGMTLIEVIISLTISTMVLTAVVSTFQLVNRGTTSLVDRSDLETQGRQAMRVIRSLLREAVDPSGKNFDPDTFNNLPNSNPWDFRNTSICCPSASFDGAIHFFADIDGDDIYEWVWIWVDPLGLYDQKGDTYPRPPFLKMTAFYEYPNKNLGQWADYSKSFFKMINEDPRTYFVLASNLTPGKTQIINGNSIRTYPGFGVDFRNNINRAYVYLSMYIDRDRNDDVGAAEPVVVFRENMDMVNMDYPSGSVRVPDTTRVSSVSAKVRDNALPLVGTAGLRLLNRY